MKRKQKRNLLLLVLLFSFSSVLWIGKLADEGNRSRLKKDTVKGEAFREQNFKETILSHLEGRKNKGLYAGIYLLESKFGYESFPYTYTEKSFRKLKKKWEKKKEWEAYLNINQAIWNDVKYFPVPLSNTDKEASAAFENSWMNERNYGGKRGHEGTDLMASQNVRGLYPVVSMTDGVVQNKGWLPKGGWRIGILSPSGGYFYYAHLDSYANVEEGERVYAGDILGFMGDSGYGEKGTTGKFPVHLHIGIYVYPQGEEISVNPYWILRYLKNHRLKCNFSDAIEKRINVIE